MINNIKITNKHVFILKRQSNNNKNTLFITGVFVFEQKVFLKVLNRKK